MSNIEQCEKYMKKQNMIGNQIFKFILDKERDAVLLERYIEDTSDFKVITIPSFVTGIMHRSVYTFAEDSIFGGVKQSLKVINKSKIKDIMFMFNRFCGKELDLSNFNTGNVIDMGAMFYGCESMREINLSSFDTSKVESMRSMFDECYSLKELDLSNFNTSNVTNMSNMLLKCRDLEKVNLSSFDTSKVTDMGSMFNACSSLEEIDLSNFSTESVKNVAGMFNLCDKLKQIDLSNFHVPNKESAMLMINHCNKLEKIITTDSAILDVLYREKKRRKEKEHGGYRIT